MLNAFAFTQPPPYAIVGYEGNEVKWNQTQRDTVCIIIPKGGSGGCVEIVDEPSAQRTYGGDEKRVDLAEFNLPNTTSLYCYADYPHFGMSVVIIILASIRLLMEMSQLLSTDGIVQFLTSFNNLIEWACFIMAILFVIDFDKDGKIVINDACSIKLVNIFITITAVLYVE